MRRDHDDYRTLLQNIVVSGVGELLCKRWIAPPVRFVKMNVDGSYM